MTTDGAYVRAQVNAAASKAEDATHKLRLDEYHALEDIGKAINQARAAIEVTLRAVLSVIQDVRDAKESASLVLLGSSGMVSESLVMLNDADLNQEEMAVALQKLKEDLNQIMNITLPAFIRDKDNDAAKTNAAAQQLRAYATTVP